MGRKWLFPVCLTAMFLLFLLPGLPKDVLSYAAGFSGMRILEFVVLSGLVRSPARVNPRLGTCQ